LARLRSRMRVPSNERAIEKSLYFGNIMHFSKLIY
jgi:hypothetical protein